MGEFFKLPYTQLFGLLCSLVSPNILCSGSLPLLLSKCKNARYSSVFIQQSINCSYNEKAQEWMQIGIKEMQRANLQLFVYGSEFPLISDQSRPGKYFPIRDNCSKSDDPSVGCIYVSSYSLTTNVTLTKDYYIPFVIFDGPLIVVNTTLRKSKLLKSIQSVCIRVRWNETQFILDSPSEWSIYGDAVGCEASNRWKSVTYGKEVLDTIPIHVRTHRECDLDSALSRSQSYCECLHEGL